MALRRVFTYLGAVFLMSHIVYNYNAGALDTTFDMTTYEPVIRQIYDRVDCKITDLSNNNTTTTTNQHYCSINGTGTFGISSITTHNNISFKRGDIIEIDLLSFSVSGDSATYLITPSLSDNNNFRIMGYKDVSDGTYFNVGLLDINTGEIFSSVKFYKLTRFTLYVQNDFTGLVGFATPNVAQHPVVYFSQSSLGLVNSTLVNLIVYRNRSDGQSQDQKNEINATNESVQESEDAGADSESDAQTGTASLISTIGSAVSAITSASPTNCLLNGNMGNFDMGQIDLCANPVPAFVQIIGSLILILVTVPLCIVLFNRFIGLFRSFQG